MISWGSLPALGAFFCGARLVDARDLRDVAMLLAADIFHHAHVAVIVVYVARDEIARVIDRIMDRDHVLEPLAFVQSAQTLGRLELIAVRKPGRIEERVLVETGGVDDENRAFPGSPLMPVPERKHA